MQRQAIANAHTASAGNVNVNNFNNSVGPSSNPGMGGSGMGQSNMGGAGMGQSSMGQSSMGGSSMGQSNMGGAGMGGSSMGSSGMQYTPQQIAAAAASNPLTPGASSGGMSNSQNVPIRSYLDKTVIPILADGKFMHVVLYHA